MKFPSFFKKKQIEEAPNDSESQPLESDQQQELSSEVENTSIENFKKDLKTRGGKNFSMMYKFIIGFTLLFVIIYIVLPNNKNSSNIAQQSAVQKPATRYDPTTSAGVISSEPFKEGIKEFNNENATAALENRKSSQAVLLATSGEPPPLGNTPTTSPMPAPINQTQVTSVNQGAIQANIARAQAIEKIRMDDFNNLAKALSFGTTTESITLPIEGPATLAKNTIQKNAVSTTNQSDGLNNVGATILIEAFKDFYATLDFAASTDENTMVIATIKSGPYKGAKIKGILSMTEGDSGKIIFTQLKIPGMSEIAISAQGVNLETREMLVSGELDRKLWQRYGMPFISSMIGAYGTLMTTQGQVTTAVAGVGTVTTQPVLSDIQIRQAAAGQAVGQIASSLRTSGAAAKPAFKIEAGQDIGVIFLSDVTSK